MLITDLCPCSQCTGDDPHQEPYYEVGFDTAGDIWEEPDYAFELEDELLNLFSD